MYAKLNEQIKAVAPLLALVVVIALLLVGAGLLVYDAQIVQPGLARVSRPVAPVGEIGAAATGTGRFTSVYGTLQTTNQPNVTNLGTQTYFTATNSTITSSAVTTDTILSSLSLAGETFTGATKYGTAATYTSGDSITHGFATTPTICMLWPIEVTATLTITTTGFSSDTATHSNPVYWLCGK